MHTTCMLVDDVTSPLPTLGVHSPATGKPRRRRPTGREGTIGTLAQDTAGDALNSAAAAAARGDRLALADVVAIIDPLILRYCRRRLATVHGCPQAAEDVAQEVMLAVVTALPRYRNEDRFLAFAYAIAANKVSDAYRAHIRNPATTVAELPHRPALDPQPEDRALQAETRAELDRLLEQLPLRHRRILYARLIFGLSVNETAAVLEMTPASIRVAQHRALARLRDHLEVTPADISAGRTIS